MSRWFILTMMLALSLLSTASMSASTEPDVAFVLGFKTLAELIPDVAGAPLENEHHNPVNGDGLQMTSTWLMVWRKADNWTAFTNGWWTWVNGPYGLQDRANEERFDWEREATATDGTRIVDGAASPSASLSPLSTVSPASLAAYRTPSPSETPPGALQMPTVTATPRQSPTPLPTASPTPRPSATPVPTRRPSATPRPTSTAVPTHTPVPTHTAVPTDTATPTATPTPPGIRSTTPAGEWVTSVATSVIYYCAKSSTYWQSWSSGNLIWFDSESELLEVYPGRIRKQ